MADSQQSTHINTALTYYQAAEWTTTIQPYFTAFTGLARPPEVARETLKTGRTAEEHLST